jgi:transposase-like protein
MSDTDLMTTAEVANHLKVSAETVRDWWWQWSSNPGPPGQAIRAHLGHFNIADD